MLPILWLSEQDLSLSQKASACRERIFRQPARGNGRECRLSSRDIDN